ncbi:MAG: acyltransferase family protein [Bdellovibrionota bacterium]
MESQIDLSRNPAIDGLRGWAAIWITLGHLAVTSLPMEAFVLKFFGGTFIPVDIFFCVSGFLILNSYEQRPREGLYSFYVRRFLRIVPLWWAILAFFYFEDSTSGVSALLNASFLFGFFLHHPKYIALAPAWSLFIEAVFILPFPL